jgi:hypothetical protein
MTALIILESPMIHSGFPSPDLRRSESSGSRYPPPHLSVFLSQPSPASLLPLLEDAQRIPNGKGKGNDLRTRLILRHALQWAVERCDIDLVSWLINLDGRWVGRILL